MVIYFPVIVEIAFTVTVVVTVGTVEIHGKNGKVFSVHITVPVKVTFTVRRVIFGYQGKGHVQLPAFIFYIVNAEFLPAERKVVNQPLEVECAFAIIVRIIKEKKYTGNNLCVDVVKVIQHLLFAVDFQVEEASLIPYIQAKAAYLAGKFKGEIDYGEPHLLTASTSASFCSYRGIAAKVLCAVLVAERFHHYRYFTGGKGVVYVKDSCGRHVFKISNDGLCKGVPLGAVP